MDTYLAIAGLAVSLAALVPILFPATRVRFWTITAGFLSLAILIAGYQVYKEVVEAREVKAARKEIWSLLTKNQKGMTFDQIYDNMYFPNFSVANTAIDEMVSDQEIQSEKIEAMATNGAKYVVRRFYRNFE